jgi:hypothetical protein
VKGKSIRQHITHDIPSVSAITWNFSDPKL